MWLNPLNSWTDFVKTDLDSNFRVSVPVSSVRIVPLNQPRKKGANRSYPHGDGVKRCKHILYYLINFRKMEELNRKLENNMIIS